MPVHVPECSRNYPSTPVILSEAAAGFFCGRFSGPRGSAVEESLRAVALHAPARDIKAVRRLGRSSYAMPGMSKHHPRYRVARGFRAKVLAANVMGIRSFAAVTKTSRPFFGLTKVQ